MSTFARLMQRAFEEKKLKTDIIKLIDFYRPLRGDMRRPRSRAGSLLPDEEADAEGAK